MKNMDEFLFQKTLTHTFIPFLIYYIKFSPFKSSEWDRRTEERFARPDSLGYRQQVHNKQSRCGHQNITQGYVRIKENMSLVVHVVTDDGKLLLFDYRY